MKLLFSYFKKVLALILISVFLPTFAYGETNWADWTSIGTDTASNVGTIGNGWGYTYVTTASGTLQDAATSATANLTHTGEVITDGTSDVGSMPNGFTGWTDAGGFYPAAAFFDPNGNVGSPAAVNADILQHAGYTVESAKVHTITFDREVSGVVMAIWSLGGQGDATMRFSEDFVIAPTSTADGFAVQVSNYDAAYTWAVSTDEGSATISNTGLVTVTGLTPGQSATVTVTTTRTGYANGTVAATGSASVAALGSPTATPVPALPLFGLLTLGGLLGLFSLRKLKK